MNQIRHGAFMALIIFILSSCESGPRPLEDILRTSVNTKINPFEKVPLSSVLTFVTEEACKVTVEVQGDIPIERTFDKYEKNHEIPIIGLYPDRTNIVHITLTTQSNTIYTGQVELKTDPLPATFPNIEITKIDSARMEPGFHLIDMLIANNGKFLTYTILFDDNGDIRWFMDMSSQGQITYSGYRLKNGNWLYLDWINILEVTDLGQVVKKEQMWGNAGTHEVIELPNGRLLMGGSKKDAMVVRAGGKKVNTRHDHVVLWDRKLNRTIKDWDLRKVLDIDRSVIPPDFNMDFEADWFHINAVTQSPKDNALVISGRNQGVVKIDQDNELKWIMAPHVNWGKAGYDGNGLQTTDYLLTAVDENGEPLPPMVQVGEEGTEDFEWSSGQHAVSVLPNENILLFDNGLMRNLDPAPTYSRAVEYKIDEKNKTIQQVWEYGKGRGLDMFSPITSDVDVLPKTGNRLIVAGNIRKSELAPHAKVIEITHPENKVVFEAKIFFKDALGTKANDWAQFDLVFRGERYPLIPVE